jgi:hypothetical protein
MERIWKKADVAYFKDTIRVFACMNRVKPQLEEGTPPSGNETLWFVHMNVLQKTSRPLLIANDIHLHS